MAYQDSIQALADPTRRAVFEQLREGPLPVGELAAKLPVTRPAVSQHLKVLKNAGLVQERKMGTRRIYSVQVQGLKELRLYLESFWGDVLTAFEEEANRTGALEKRRNNNDED
jgi:DNA-binding transcriptional ArsR family regulator